MTAADWPAVAQIYQEGIDTGNATFAPAPPPSWEAWCQGKITACSLVARGDSNLLGWVPDPTILGWVALGPYSSRAVYAGVAEVSIYLSARARGQGVGSALLQAVINLSETNGLWTLQAGIFPENQASLKLHTKHGFRQVGVREKLGRMAFGPWAGQWRDVILLERRSLTVGCE